MFGDEGWLYTGGDMKGLALGRNPPVIRISHKWINVRKKPSIYARKIGVLFEGEEARILNQDGTGGDKWLKISLPTSSMRSQERNDKLKPFFVLPKSVEEDDETPKFSVMQYNILANAYSDQRWFRDVHPNALGWERRKQTVLQDISGLAADIVCLEELDHFTDVFEPEFKNRGFECAYKQRPDSKKGGHRPDGCGIFWRQSHFRMLEERSINYADDTDRVGLLVALEYVTEPELRDVKKPSLTHMVVVACTHLYWDAAAVSVQAAQISAFCKEIQVFVEALWEKNGFGGTPSLPVVLCGDFNCGPSSETYDVVRKHPLTFTSAYGCAYTPGGADNMHGPAPGMVVHEPPYTRVTKEKREAVDYIWFTQPWIPPPDASEWKGAAPFIEDLSGALPRPPSASRLSGGKSSRPPSAKGSSRSPSGSRPTSASSRPGSAKSKRASTRSETPPLGALSSRLCLVGVLPVPRLCEALKDWGGLPNHERGSDHVPLVCRFSMMPA